MAVDESYIVVIASPSLTLEGSGLAQPEVREAIATGPSALQFGDDDDDDRRPPCACAPFSCLHHSISTNIGHTQQTTQNTE